jgi:hypothetical protein
MIELIELPQYLYKPDSLMIPSIQEEILKS